ncbi:hypothetical protein FGO68_gene13370 [Halteria grandinella]|uniref:Uncharacterized protein n=1 Tax=Halteria grandinella TaxID=5974 RepID=A0A8J8NHH7_HALGN|nr:hypothetical protein FGO68_gene13370 [Halteria grandinella]
MFIRGLSIYTYCIIQFQQFFSYGVTSFSEIPKHILAFYFILYSKSFSQSSISIICRFSSISLIIYYTQNLTCNAQSNLLDAIYSLNYPLGPYSLLVLNRSIS